MAKTPRPASTYRGARRNAARAAGWSTWRGVAAIYAPSPPVRANRSRKWPDIHPRDADRLAAERRA